jgi:hypothetical protein
MRRIKPICFASFIAVALALAIGVYAKLVFVSRVYCVEARVQGPAEIDERFAEWLRSQAGIVRHTVSLNRRGPDNDTLEIVFIQSRNSLGDPPFPDLETAAKSLGYTGDNVYFRDCEDRRR